jgi:hypothetical protein
MTIGEDEPEGSCVNNSGMDMGLFCYLQDAPPNISETILLSRLSGCEVVAFT